MALQQVLARYPNTVSVLGHEWLIGEQSWAVAFIEDRVAWYGQLEVDLSALLCAGIPLPRLVQCYRDSLRNRTEVLKAIYEIHAGALLAACSQRVEIHVSRGDGSNRNYDIGVEIEGTYISVECKTRKDEFPFNMPAQVAEDGSEMYGGSRGTLDPHDAATMGFTTAPNQDPSHKATPESTVVRQILSTALGQLPPQGFSMVVFGQIEGNLHHLEDALFGTEYVELRRNLETGQTTSHWLRAPNGAFNAADGAFDSISSALWVRLSSDGDVLRKTYRGFLNPRARNPLPEVVVARLRALVQERGTGAP